MTIDGPVVLDIVQHFIERWNMIKGLKVSNYIHPEILCHRPKYSPHISIKMIGWSFRPSPSPLFSILLHSSRYDWLAFPHDVEAAPDEAIARHPYRMMWHHVGRHFRQRFHRPHGDRGHAYQPGDEFYSRPPYGSCRVQVVRSVSDWSHGVLTEHSIQNACERSLTVYPNGD